MKYEFILTDKMKEDRFMCGKDDNICEECSCCMGNSDCVFNHLYVTAEQEYDIEEDFDPETRTVRYTVGQKQTDEIKVGDEVQSNYKDKDLNIVTELAYGGDTSILGCINGHQIQKDKVHKTGRHFPQVAKIMEQLRRIRNE